jgi:protein tyrosine phosphatase (PTP) superfamily phosphohydrolase (DUF442 family)
MFRLDWLQAGSATRGTPRREHTRPRRWPALGLLACVVLFQSGCQSGPFSHCGDGTGLFSPCGFFGRVSNRVFNRSNGGCCPSGAVPGGAVEYGAPAAVVTPGVVTGSAVSPSYLPPGASDATNELNAITPDNSPKTRIIPQGNGSGGTGAQPKSGYLPRSGDSGTRVARRRTDNPTRTMASTPEPTSRSAQAPSRRGSRDARAADDQDPLDHLPPLDLPGEVTRSSATPPAAPTAVPAARPLDNDAKKPEPPRESAAAPAKELDLTSATSPAPEPAQSASVGPGLARFVAVDLKLAGGSVPSGAGLDWLVEKGYRTVLDLRESPEVPSSFIAEVASRGLRYVALPIGLGSLDRDHVARFNFEIAAGDARPLFFFDSDGTRAGALWYIRRIATDRVDQQIARREAEELGLTDKSYWSAVTNFVGGLGSSPKSADAREARSSSDPAPSQASFAGSTATGKPAQSPGSSSASTPARQQDESKPQTRPAAVSPAGAPSIPDAQPSQPSPPQSQTAAGPDSTRPVPTISGDPLAWRPFVAMAITGLSLPLVYWTRTTLPTVLGKALASLPGPAHRPKSLPDELGA